MNLPIKILNFKARIAFLIVCLNMAQYISIGFFSESLAAILRQDGLSLEKIGAVYFIGLFYGFRFLWAPFVEFAVAKMGGVYKNFITVVLMLMIVSLGITAFLNVRENLSFILAMAGMLGFLSATSAIASSALIIKISTPQNLAGANSLAASGNFIGHVLGTGVTLIIYSNFGWKASTIFLIFLTIVALFMIATFKERPRELERGQNRVSFKSMALFFKDKKFWLSVLMIQGIGVCMSFGLINPILVDSGRGLDEIGKVVHIYGLCGVIIGSITASYLINKLGNIKTMILAMPIQAFGILTLLLPILGYANLIILILVCQICFAVYTIGAVSISTMIMSKATKSPVSECALQSSISMLFQYLSFALGFVIASLVGYKITVIFSFVICFIVCLYLLKFKKLM
ncbi:MFS transporter [Campylobacter sp. MOP7]|uniref:MFS transporter n=1 Tax=Campylobacter canis TaxID=3378588 RepID=UPI00387E6459